MPRYSKAKSSVVSVKNWALDYGFPCRASAAARGALGIREFTGESNTAFGANRPKPPRAKHVPSKETSFMDMGIKADGVNVQLVAAGKTPMSQRQNIVAVEVYGVWWAWSLAPDVKTKIESQPGYDALGVSKLPSGAASVFAVYGASSVFIKNPKTLVRSPLRAKKKVGDSTYSTFTSTPFTDPIPLGWDIS